MNLPRLQARHFKSISYAPGLGFSVTSIRIPDVSPFLYLALMAGGFGGACPAGNSPGTAVGSTDTLYHPSGAPDRPFVTSEYLPSGWISPIALSLEVFPLL